MFFKKQYSIDIIDNEINEDDLEQFAIEHDLPKDFGNEGNKWFVFGIKYALDHGLHVITAKSFGYMLNKVFANSSLFSKTTKYIDEKRIYESIKDSFKRCNVTDDETDTAIVLFERIFSLYKNDIRYFSKKTETLTIKLSYDMLDEFMSLPREDELGNLEYLFERYEEYQKLEFFGMYDYTDYRHLVYHFHNKLKFKRLYSNEFSGWLYEGYTLNNKPCGLGTLYYPNGNKCQEGIFDIKGLVHGKDYYMNGQVCFEGIYSINHAYGPNAPRYGKFYDKDGNLKYNGEFQIRTGGVGYPIVVKPEEFGSLALLHHAIKYLMWEDIRDLLDEELKGYRRFRKI